MPERTIARSPELTTEPSMIEPTDGDPTSVTIAPTLSGNVVESGVMKRKMLVLDPEVVLGPVKTIYALPR